jgi:hypothetical protein
MIPSYVTPLFDFARWQWKLQHSAQARIIAFKTKCATVQFHHSLGKT